MAHFAEINEDGFVLRVIVVGDADTQDESGNENEAIGAAFCATLLGGTWLQCSYNASIRDAYPGPGWTYDANTDAFVAPPVPAEPEE